ncbi:MAG: Ig-like domain-containing protein, partial [Bacilli bacterium]
GETYDLTWTSSDEAIATVGEKGTVTGIKAGEVTITAALTEFPEIKAEYSLKIITELPTLKETIERLDEERNYTITVTKGEEETGIFLYTPDKIRIETINGTIKKYAIGKDGIAFPYEVEEDGTINPGNKLKTLSGYVTKDTFFGDAADPYYPVLPGIGGMDVTALPETPDEGTDGTYSDFASPEDYVGDRYSMNKNLIGYLCDIDTFDFLYCRASMSSFSATVNADLSLGFSVTAKLRGGSYSDYLVTISEIGTTEIEDDGIDAYLEIANGGDAFTDSSIYGLAKEMDILTSYTISDGYGTNAVFTPDYMYYYMDDTVFDEYYDPEYYSYDGGGYVKLDDGIYSFTEDVSYDIDTEVLTRSPLTLGEKIEGTDADSKMDEVIGYINTWAIWDNPDILVDTKEFMSTSLGWATGAKDIAQDSLDKIEMWGDLLYSPWVNDEADELYGYRTHIVPTMYYPSTYLSYCTFTLMVGYQEENCGAGISSGYTYANFPISKMNGSSSSKIVSWSATL